MLKKLLCTLTALVMLVTPVLAIKGEVVNPDELPYIPTEGSPSSWAASEIKKAADAGLIPQFTGDPSYQDEITREQFAQLAVRLVEVIQKEELPAAAQSGRPQGQPGGYRHRHRRRQVRPHPHHQPGADRHHALPGCGRRQNRHRRGSGPQGRLCGRLHRPGFRLPLGALSPQEPCSVEQAILLAWRLYEQFTSL